MKKSLRIEAQQLLKSLSIEKKQDIEEVQRKFLLESELWSGAKTIGVTVSQPLEWDTVPLIEAGWAQGKQMVVPKCKPVDKSMQFYKLDRFDQLETVYYGIQEPDPSLTEHIDSNEMDLIIVPGLLFNSQGYRLGFGGGYYDRFLAEYSGSTIMIVSEEQRQEKIPVESFDQPVKYLLTEMGIQAVI